MNPTFSQLFAEVTLASADTSPLEEALALALDFVERETDFYDLGRALGKAYPGNTPLPDSLNRVTLPRQAAPGPDRWHGQATRDLVVALHTYQLGELALTLLLHAQQRTYVRAKHPEDGPPWQHKPSAQAVNLLHSLIRLHDPRVAHATVLRNQFVPLDRLPLGGETRNAQLQRTRNTP